MNKSVPKKNKKEPNTYLVVDTAGKYLTDEGFTSYSEHLALKYTTVAAATRLAIFYNAYVLKCDRDNKKV